MRKNISPNPNHILQELLKEHGYDAKISGERIVLIGHEAQMGSDVYFHSTSNPAHLQLDVRVHLPDGRTLVESFSGIGATMEYAMGDAFSSFCQGSLHVLLRAFFGDTYLDAEEWYFPHGHFHAIIGDMSIRGKDVMTQEEAVECFRTFTTLMHSAPVKTREFHWIRLYYAQHEGKMMVCEVLFNNEVWEEAQKAMSNYAWPQIEEFYSVRLFLILQPQNNSLPPEWVAQWLN